MIPYKPYVRKKHVESILGTFLTHENKNIFDLNTTISNSVHLVDPFLDITLLTTYLKCHTCRK
jgi:hypothetical protein